MDGFIDWLVSIPVVLLFLGLLAVGLIVAFGLTALAERAFEDDVRTRTSTSVTTVVGVIAGLYAVLIAFVIVNEWQSFNSAQTQVSNESAALASTYFSAGALPQPGAGAIQKSILAYDRSVVCVEFPQLASNSEPALATRAALKNLYTTVARVGPSVGDSAFYASTVRGLDDVAQARRGRINAATSSIPDLLLAVIALTSLALIAAVSALDTKHRRWHALIMVALTVIVALNFTLVLALYRPFDGAAKVSDSPLREGVPAAQLRCS